MPSSSFAVTAGTPRVVPAPPGRPTNIAAIPGSGGSLLVETSTTPDALVTPASATWFTWPAGTVSTKTQQAFYGAAIALRFTATTVDGVVEVAT